MYIFATSLEQVGTFKYNSDPFIKLPILHPIILQFKQVGCSAPPCNTRLKQVISYLLESHL